MDFCSIENWKNVTLNNKLNMYRDGWDVGINSFDEYIKFIKEVNKEYKKYGHNKKIKLTKKEKEELYIFLNKLKTGIWVRRPDAVRI